MPALRIGVVGCGAVAAKSHLPALRSTEGVEVTALADPQIDRARELALRFGVPKAVADHRELLDDVDALVLALPHHLHASIGTEVLRLGKHVLMEKPLANTLEECDALIRSAAEGESLLAVAQVRRHMLAYRATREWVQSGLIGEPLSFRAEEGSIYNWPVASDFFFRREHSGGGVLMDTGAHVLDALLWWLGDLEVVRYEDDGRGGVEADCLVELEASSGATGSVRLSRIRRLENRLVLVGTRATLEVDLLANRASLLPEGARTPLTGVFSRRGREEAQSTLDLFERQATEWVHAIQREPASIATAGEARETIRLISDAYAKRVARVEAWQLMDAAGDA